MKKWLLLILGLIVAGSLFIFLAKDLILKTGMEQAVTALTGFKTRVRTLKYDLPSTVRVQDLEILNPAGFESKVFAKVPEVYISFFADDFFRGKGVRFGEIRLFVREIYLEKNAKGVSNVELLNLAGVGPEQLWRLAKRVPFLVERLELTLRNVSYEDYSHGGAGGSPYRYAADLNVQNKTYLMIRDPQALVNLVLYEILRHATFKKLLDLGPEKFLSGAWSAGQAYAGQGADALTRGAGNMAGQATGLVNRAGIPQKAGSALQSSVRGTQDALSGFWGKLRSILPSKKTTSSNQPAEG